VLERFTLLFPLWTLLGVVLALPFPWLFTWLQGPLIVLALGVIMLGMGLELQPADFRRVLRRPRPVALGVIGQFSVMPLLAAALAWGLGLEPPLAVGLILVGCCPGGTASNVVTLIARADVALSVVMTTASTLLAVVLTPAAHWASGRSLCACGRLEAVVGRVAGGAAAPGRRHWPQTRHPAAGPLDRTVDASTGSAGDCSDRGQHCGQPTAGLAGAGPAVIPRGAVAAWRRLPAGLADPRGRAAADFGA